MQLKAILCRTLTKKQLCNAYYKITLTYYTSTKFIKNNQKILYF